MGLDDCDIAVSASHCYVAMYCIRSHNVQSMCDKEATHELTYKDKAMNIVGNVLKGVYSSAANAFCWTSCHKSRARG
jgi:hypothetical protein